MERNPTQNLSSPLLGLHPCTFLFSSWEFPSSSSPPALVTATALITQQTEQVLALVLFWRSFAGWITDQKTSQRPKKKCKKEKMCLAWAEPVGQEDAGLWQEELDTAGRCQWGSVDLRISSGAVLASWPGTPCSAELLSISLYRKANKT